MNAHGYHSSGLPLAHIPPMHPPWTTNPAAPATDGQDDEHDAEDDYDDGEPDGMGDKQSGVRRRSSKACDQCRKSKCKCERTGTDGEPCRNCIMLGTECTFLGPSRKRGPPKGYIDAIENRLHQVEALLGVFINSSDPRAISLLNDVSGENTAREIIERVTLAPYGSKASRKKRDGSGGGEGHSHSRGKAEITSTQGRIPPFSIPIKDWQDGVTKHIVEGANRRLTSGAADDQQPGVPMREVIRRRTGDYSPSTLSKGSKRPMTNGPSLNPKQSSASLISQSASSPDLPNSQGQDLSDDSENEIASGVGQLSLNEHEQFRYHGLVSGLHLLGRHKRLDRRNEGGIWRFPQAKMWAGASAFGLRTSGADKSKNINESLIQLGVGGGTGGHDELQKEIRRRLPKRDEQEHLLGLFWTYVHPVLPVLDKEAVMNAWRDEMDASDPTTAVHGQNSVDGEDTNMDREKVEVVTVGDSPPVHIEDKIRETQSPSPQSDRRPSHPTSHRATASASPHAPSDSLPQPGYRSIVEDREASVSSHHSSHPSHRPRVPLLLLLCIFSISARFSSRSPPQRPGPNQTWDAGDSVLADSYLADARTLLNHTYSSSRPSTCQALLLLSYREIGVGAMAAAWLYVGMAVRMAQDLGMHRKSERWVWKDPSAADSKEKDKIYARGVFNARERQVRKKIWYACVIMDKYVSTYIGRPLSIFERDFDTPLPDEQEAEEAEMWYDDTSDPPPGEVINGIRARPVQSHALSNFNQAARLSSILSDIVTSMYSVRDPPANTSRQIEYIALEERLDKWYLGLPEHLSLEKFSHQHQVHVQEENRIRRAKGSGPVETENDHWCTKCAAPPPHLFTLHMFYWCTVLLLHRPFIRARLGNANSPSKYEHEGPYAQISHKPFDLCMTAAGHITSIVSLYAEHYCLLRSPPFFTYYVFTAGIMYVTALSIQADNPQAGLGLQKCMDCLQRMDRTWPSAGRQWELLHGSKLDLREAELGRLNQGERRNKRSAETLETDHRELASGNRIPVDMHIDSRVVKPVNGVTQTVKAPNYAPVYSRPLLNVNTASSSRAGEPPSTTSESFPTPFTARPYHLGLDLGGGPLGQQQQQMPNHGTAQKTIFSSFDRWPTASEFPSQAQQPPADIFDAQHQLMDAPPLVQGLRHPMSSARTPTYWDDYGDSSMMGSSLYSLPLIPDPMAGSAMPSGPGTFFTDSDYPIFNNGQ